MRGSMDVEQIAVIGAGQMGNGIAQTAACAEYQVTMIDISEEFLERGIEAIEFSLGKLVEKGRMSQEEADAALERISTATDNSAAADADLVIEAVPEVPKLKFSLMAELDELCKPKAILASNTSSISIDDIAASTKRPDKVIGMHFMNPVPIMRLVEIIVGSDTNSEVTAAVQEVCERMGKTALCCKDSPGFISNRLLCPMLNEAVLAFAEGIADAEAIDGIMVLGMNHPIGPLALADLVGLDTLLHIMNVLHAGFEDDKYAPAPLLEEMVAEGKLGRKSGQGFYDYS